MPDASISHRDLEDRRKEATLDAKRLPDFRRYARGRHRNPLQPTQRAIISALTGHIFSDNICGRVLSTLRDRLALARFEAEADSQVVQAALLDWLRDWWVKNRLPLLAGRVHYAALRDGNHVLALGYRKSSSPDEPGLVYARRELWWDGKRGFWVAYDGDGQPEFGVKEWKQGTRTFRTVYYPDRMERFERTGSGWVARSLDTDPPGSRGVVPWTRNMEPGGEPIGLPFVHFANGLDPQDPDFDDKEQPDPLYGASELDGGILGLQDEVNSLHRDLTIASRFTAFQTLYVTGYSGKTPDGGQPGTDGAADRVVVEPGSVLTERNSEAKVGAIPAASLDSIIAALDRKIRALSEGRQVPVHYITGQWPSGEAILRAEAPLVNKATGLARAFAPAWGSLAHKATVLHNVFGGGDLDESVMLTALFHPPEQLDAATLAAIAKAREGIVSQQEQLRILGYSPEQVELIMKEKEAEKGAQAEAEQLRLQRERLNLESDQAAAEARRALDEETDNPDGR